MECVIRTLQAMSMIAAVLVVATPVWLVSCTQVGSPERAAVEVQARPADCGGEACASPLVTADTDVRLGPTTGPAVVGRADVQVGATTGPAVVGRADVAGQADLDVGGQRQVSGDAPSDQYAGDDARQVVVQAQLAGSALAAVLMGAVVLGVLAVVSLALWLRAQQRRHQETETYGHAMERAVQEYARQQSQLLAVAQAVADQPPGVYRDRLLHRIGQLVPDRPAFDRWLSEQGLRVRATDKQSGKGAVG